MLEKTNSVNGYIEGYYGKLLQDERKRILNNLKNLISITIFTAQKKTSIIEKSGVNYILNHG